MAYDIGFIGAGAMAKALARGFTDSGVVDKSKIHLTSPVPAEMDECKALGFNCCAGNIDLINKCDIVILAIKPQVMPMVSVELKKKLDQDRAAKVVFISIIAGITLNGLEDLLPAGANSKVIRTMPNTPCLVGAGATGLSPNVNVSREVIDFAVKIFASTGIAFEVNEAQLDGFIGLTGSGVAFVYTIIEAYSDAGVKHGLTRPVATQLALQTLLGGVKMVQDTGMHPAVLREQVTSPGGTTIYGVAATEEHGLRNSILKGVDAVVERTHELGRPSKM